jgi:hypothetical protein
VQNVTTSVSTMSAESVGLFTTVCVVFTTVLLLILVSKNFRNFIYGSVVSICIILLYKFSRYIGVETAKGNIIPITYFAYVAIFIIVSIIIGFIVRKTELVKIIEKNLDDTKPNKK